MQIGALVLLQMLCIFIQWRISVFLHSHYYGMYWVDNPEIQMSGLFEAQLRVLIFLKYGLGAVLFFGWLAFAFFVSSRFCRFAIGIKTQVISGLLISVALLILPVFPELLRILLRCAGLGK